MQYPYQFLSMHLGTQDDASAVFPAGAVLDGTEPFSIDAMVWLESTGPEQYILKQENAFTLGVEDGRLFFELNGYPVIWSSTGKNAISGKTWHYICVTYSSGSFRIYVDGLFDRMLTASGSGKKYAGDFLFGGQMAGRLRFVRVYNKCLSLDEVQTCHTGTPGPGMLWADYEFSRQVPAETKRGTPITLNKKARVVCECPSVQFGGFSCIKPTRETPVNPAGYNSSSYTVQAWIYPQTAASGKMVIFENHTSTSDVGMSLYLKQDGDALYLFSSRGNESVSSNILKSTVKVPVGSWTNVAVTFDKSALRLYIDGTEAGSSSDFYPMGIVSETGNISIGCGIEYGEVASSTQFIGAISGVDVWSAALSDSKLKKYALGQEEDKEPAELAASYSFIPDDPRDSVSGAPVSGYQVNAADTLGISPVSDEAVNLELSVPSPIALEEYPELLKDLQAFKDALPDLLLEAEDNVNAELLSYGRGDELTLLRENAGRRPDGFPCFFVGSVRRDGKYIFILHHENHSYEICAMDEEMLASGEYEVWLTELVILILAGILNLMLGIAIDTNRSKFANAVKKIMDNPLFMQKISQLVTAVSASGILEVIKVIRMEGLLWDLVKAAVGPVFWLIYYTLKKVLSYCIGARVAELIASATYLVASVIYKISQKPAPVPQLQLESICFNHNQPNVADAITIRFNGSLLVSCPEWVSGQRYAADFRSVSAANPLSAAAYSVARVKGKSIFVEVKFLFSCAGTVWVRANAALLGQSKPLQLSLNGPGSTGGVLLEFDKHTIDCVKKQNITIIWEWSSDNKSYQKLISTNHIIYTILSYPEEPWKNNRSGSAIPWAEALEYACEWADGAQTEQSIVASITKRVNEKLGLKYNQNRGGCVYTTFDSASTMGQKGRIYLTSFINFLGNIQPNRGNALNCSDCATIVATFSNLLGCDLYEIIMQKDRTRSDAFSLNPLIEIGSTQTSKITAFLYHEVAAELTIDLDDTRIYDACLSVNNVEEPWALAKKSFELANPMKFSTMPLQSPFVPYAKVQLNSYRELLAANTDRGIPRCCLFTRNTDNNNGRRQII